MKLRIKYLRDIEPVQKIKTGDWIDLRCAERTEMEPGDYQQIPLGVAVQLPEGYEAIIAPRSSLFNRHGIILVNSLGVIDESYCGDGDEWNFLAYATRHTIIEKNERICQFRIIRHQPDCEIETVETLGNPDRGGIGSTGKG